jgi:hypothetical protein
MSVETTIRSITIMNAKPRVKRRAHHYVSKLKMSIEAAKISHTEIGVIA